MVSNQEILNFLQDFGCARAKHLQILFEFKNDNFKRLLSTNMVSRKDGIYVHNTRRIDERMLIALDLLCEYKFKMDKFCVGYDPVKITFFSTIGEMYHIIVADEDNRKSVVKIVNNSLSVLPKADKLILLFPDGEDLKNLSKDISFMYVKYPELQILN